MSHPLAIEHEAVYPHSPERVWRALIDPTELAAWLMPTDFAPVVGREFKLETGVAGDRHHPGRGARDRRAPACCAAGGAAVFGDTEVTFELTPEGDGTRLRVRHDGWDDPPAAERAGFDDGWKQKLDEEIPRVLGPA